LSLSLALSHPLLSLSPPFKPRLLFHFRAQQSAAAAASGAGGAGGAGGGGGGSGSQSRPGSRKLPPPLLRSRTLPAIIVPGLPVVSLHTDKQTFQLGAYYTFLFRSGLIYKK